MGFVGEIVFFWLRCEACSFSQIVPHENQHVCVFFGPYYHFSFVFWIKTNTQGNVATTCPYESPWTPTFDDLVRFWIMSVKNNPRYNVSLVDNWRHWWPILVDRLQLKQVLFSCFFIRCLQICFKGIHILINID